MRHEATGNRKFISIVLAFFFWRLTAPLSRSRQRRRQLMNLRNLIKLVAIIVLTCPIRAHAQPSASTRRIGVLTYLEENDPQSKIYLDAFVQTLQKLGWTVGRNLRIDHRSSGGDAERARKYAGELVAVAPDVILGASAAMSVRPLQRATHTIPIVFVE